MHGRGRMERMEIGGSGCGCCCFALRIGCSSGLCVLSAATAFSAVPLLRCQAYITPIGDGSAFPYSIRITVERPRDNATPADRSRSTLSHLVSETNRKLCSQLCLFALCLRIQSCFQRQAHSLTHTISANNPTKLHETMNVSRRNLSQPYGDWIRDGWR